MNPPAFTQRGAGVTNTIFRGARKRNKAGHSRRKRNTLPDGNVLIEFAGDTALFPGSRRESKVMFCLPEDTGLRVPAVRRRTVKEYSFRRINLVFTYEG